MVDDGADMVEQDVAACIFVSADMSMQSVCAGVLSACVCSTQVPVAIASQLTSQPVSQPASQLAS
jgi:hypothetical protein